MLCLLKEKDAAFMTPKKKQNNSVDYSLLEIRILFDYFSKNVRDAIWSSDITEIMRPNPKESESVKFCFQLIADVRKAMRLDNLTVENTIGIVKNSRYRESKRNEVSALQLLSFEAVGNANRYIVLGSSRRITRATSALFKRNLSR